MAVAIIVKAQYSVSKEEVWKAISEYDLMVQWYFEELKSFKPELGFETRFAVQLPNKTFTHIWKILEVIPNQKLSYSWSYEEFEGMGKVIFELDQKGGDTILTLTNEGLESFPEELPEFTRASCEGGWNYFLNERLKQFLS